MEVDPTTWLAHAGEDRELGAAAVPPIVAASYFTSQGVPDAASFHYARTGQPTWEPLEEALGGLEDASARDPGPARPAGAVAHGGRRDRGSVRGVAGPARTADPSAADRAAVRDGAPGGRVARAAPESHGGLLSRPRGPGESGRRAADARWVRAAALLRAGRRRARGRRGGGGLPDHPALRGDREPRRPPRRPRAGARGQGLRKSPNRYGERRGNDNRPSPPAGAGGGARRRLHRRSARPPGRRHRLRRRPARRPRRAAARRTHRPGAGPRPARQGRRARADGHSGPPLLRLRDRREPAGGAGGGVARRRMG